MCGWCQLNIKLMINVDLIDVFLGNLLFHMLYLLFVDIVRNVCL